MLTPAPLPLGLSFQNRVFQTRSSAFQPVAPSPIFALGPGFQDLPNPGVPGVLQFPFNPVPVGFGDFSNAVFLQQFLAEQKNLLNPQNFKPDFGFPTPLSIATSSEFTTVQSERESGKDICEAKQEQSDEDMDSSTSRAASASSLTNQSSVGASIGSSKQTQTSSSVSSNDVVFIDEELITKAQMLISAHSAVCNRFDLSPNISPEILLRSSSRGSDVLASSGPSTPPRSKKLFERISFAEIFYEPTILHQRTSLTPTGVRKATVKDLVDDWKRCFVLYSDWLLQLGEFRQLSKEDQIILAKEKFPVFHSWICGIWTSEVMKERNLASEAKKEGNVTPEIRKEGLCYSNGSFFPRQPSEHCVPDVNGMTEKIMKLFVEPLLDLQISEIEKCCVFLISLFSDDVPTISQEGREHIRKSREKFTKVLFNSTVFDVLKTSEMLKDNPFFFQRIHSSAAVRMSKVLFLASSLNSFTNPSSNKETFPDFLPIVSDEL
ncbi:hypothetical protein FO519_005942 [Halicephalobus sp. NKZ332]|nr:hypothetical protein FO519_005942 [Halicephalobus sp. NKZ332]